MCAPCSSSACIPLLAALASPFALRRGAIGVVCFSLGSRVRGNDGGVRALLLVRGHPLARCARVPLRIAKGGQSAWFMFLWIPASAGMTWVVCRNDGVSVRE